MLRILRAFAWLRWRVLLNSLERHGGRDAIERFSLAVEQLTPIAVALVMIPSAVGLAAAGAYAGWSMAQAEPQVTVMEFVRFALLAGCVFALVGPIVLPTGDRTNAVRMLLLPIPRAVLYLAQTFSTLADPWMMLVAAMVIAVPAGLAVGGAIVPAIAAAVAGLLLIAVLAGLGLVVTSGVHLAVRDRRRGEILALVLIVGLPILGLLPGIFDNDARERRRMGAAASRRQEAWWSTFERRALAIAPSEMYVRTVKRVATNDYTSGSIPLLTLFGAALALHTVALAVFFRLLNTPATAGSVRTSGRGRLSEWRIPGVSAGASAVAMNQLRLAFRTPRGRSAVLSPLVLFAVFAAVMFRSRAGASVAFIPIEGGIGLAAFTAFFALVATLPMAMNQFAVDRAGLTLMFLVPLETRTLIVGKAIGNAIVAAIPAGACIVGSLVLFPSGNPWLWPCVPLTLLSAYLLVAPAAAALSAIFPRAVDLNSIGQGSNAHGVAGLLGTLAFLAGAAPGYFLALMAARVLERPPLAPLLLVLWVALCAALSTVLLEAVVKLFEQRRENLVMVV